MTDNNQQIDNTEKTELNHKPSRRRRALVKGAAGAIPVVLTLRSGAAIAGSSVEGCIVQDNRKSGSERASSGGNKPDVLLDTGPWVRKTGTCRTLSTGGSASSFDIYTDSTAPVAGAIWQNEFNTPGGSSNKTYIEGSSFGIMIDSDGTEYDYFRTSTRSCRILVQVYPNTDLSNNDTQAIGNAVLYDGNKLPYITESCWTSVTVTALPD